MFTVRDVPLENIRDKRIFVLVDPNVERAAPALGSLRGKGARLVVATHLPDPPGGSIERLSLEFAQELSRVLGLRCALPGPSRPHPVCSEPMTRILPSTAASDATTHWFIHVRAGLRVIFRTGRSSASGARNQNGYGPAACRVMTDIHSDYSAVCYVGFGVARLDGENWPGRAGSIWNRI